MSGSHSAPSARMTTTRFAYSASVSPFARSSSRDSPAKVCQVRDEGVLDTQNLQKTVRCCCV